MGMTMTQKILAHGAGLAVLFPAWAKYMYKYNIKYLCRGVYYECFGRKTKKIICL